MVILLEVIYTCYIGLSLYAKFIWRSFIYNIFGEAVLSLTEGIIELIAMLIRNNAVFIVSWQIIITAHFLQFIMKPDNKIEYVGICYAFSSVQCRLFFNSLIVIENIFFLVEFNIQKTIRG